MVLPILGGIAAGIIGGISANRQQQNQAKADLEQQRRAHEFERQRIQMTVKDAAAAGINPLAALGVAGQGSNPYNVPATAQSDPVGEGFQTAVQSGLNFAQAKAQSDQLKQEAMRTASYISREQAEAELLRAQAQQVTAQAELRKLPQNGRGFVTYDNAPAKTRPGESPDNPAMMHNYWVAPNGQVVTSASPDLPDIDQLATYLLLLAQAGSSGAYDALMGLKQGTGSGDDKIPEITVRPSDKYKSNPYNWIGK